MRARVDARERWLYALNSQDDVRRSSMLIRRRCSYQHDLLLLALDLLHGVPAALSHEGRRISDVLLAGNLHQELVDEQHGLRVAIDAERRRKPADIPDALMIAMEFSY